MLSLRLFRPFACLIFCTHFVACNVIQVNCKHCLKTPTCLWRLLLLLLLLPVFNRCLCSLLFVRVHNFNLTLFGLVTCAIAVFLTVYFLLIQLQFIFSDDRHLETSVAHAITLALGTFVFIVLARDIPHSIIYEESEKDV